MSLDHRDAAYLSRQIHDLKKEQTALRKAVNSNLETSQELKKSISYIQERLEVTKISTDSILLSVLFFFCFLIIILQDMKRLSGEPALVLISDVLSIGGAIAIGILIARCLVARLRNR